MKRLLLRIVLLGVAFLIVTHVVPGVRLIGSPLAAFWAAVVFAALNMLVSPLAMLLKLLALPLTLVTLGLMSLLISLAINVFIFWLMSALGWGIEVRSPVGYVLGPLALSVVNSLLNMLASPIERR